MASYLKASIERSYAESFLAELERNENQYLFFAAKSTPWANENSPDAYVDTVKSEYQVMNDIVGYKKLNSENVIFALPRYEWVTGTVYAQYDDSVVLFLENNPAIFYVVTDENNIYKCISNNLGGASTQKPTQVLSSTFTTSDGYRWKYLATLKEGDLPYELTDYVPVDFATEVQDLETQNQYNAQIEATNGSLDQIVVTNSAGASAGVYSGSIVRSNITTGSGSFTLNVGSFETLSANTKRIRITESDSKARLTLISPLTDYKDYVLRIDACASNANQVNNYGVITNVVSSGNDILIDVENDVIDFVVSPTSGSNITSAEIIPYVKIMGNGSGAYAFPRMSSTKTISSIDVVNGGLGYTKVLTSVISKKTAVTNHPTTRAIISPKGGHGSNILKELNVKDILIIIKIDEQDETFFVHGGSYRQFGIIKNPLLGDGTRNPAGITNKNYRDVTIVPSTDRAFTSSDFDLGEFNVIVGSESYAASKIISTKSASNTSVVLKTINTSGKFITTQDRQNEYVLTLTTSIAQNFQDGEIITQTIPAGTLIGSVSYGFTVTVSGTVVSRSGEELGVNLTSDGNFVIGLSISGTLSSATAIVDGVSPKHGELVIIINSSGSGLASVVTNETATNQKLYRIVDVGSAYFDLDSVPSYCGLHILNMSTSNNSSVGGVDVTSSSLSANSFANGDVIQQGATGTVGNYASGTVYHWDFVNPSYGRLYVTDVLGTFKNVYQNGTTGSTLGAYVVSSVDLPEIDRTSGDVLYIDNIRPIQRNEHQEEEFRIRLGF